MRAIIPGKPCKKFSLVIFNGKSQNVSPRFREFTRIFLNVCENS